MEKNLGPVLLADVRALAVQSGWIVAFPENSQQLFVVNLRRIVVDFNCFRVPRSARADIFITRIFQRSARVTYRRRVHSLQVPEGVLYSPETTCSKRCFCHNRRSPSNYARDTPIVPQQRKPVEFRADMDRLRGSCLRHQQVRLFPGGHAYKSLSLRSLYRRVVPLLRSRSCWNARRSSAECRESRTQLGFSSPQHSRDIGSTSQD